MPHPIEVVYAVSSANIALPDGTPIPVIIGTHWPSTDPVVRARPELFSPDPRFGLAYLPSSPPPGYDAELNELDADEFESASAAPGERRSVRRPRS